MTMRERVPETVVQRWLLEYARRRDRGAAGRSRGDMPLDELRGKIADAMGPLVESCARRFQASGEPVEDLVQEGFLGLLSALEHWDPARGVKFSTYAVHFIGGSIRHFLRDRCRPIREPARVHAMARRVEEVTVELTQSLDRAPRADEVAAVLAVTEEEVGEAIGSRGRRHAASIESDDEGLGIDAPDDGLPVARLVEDRVILERALAVLKPREQEVIYECYFRDLSQVEVAKKIGVSANYVSVTLRRATDRLRRVCMESEIRDSESRREGRLVDPETGLYDRGQVHARIVEGVSRAARESEPFGLVAVRLCGMPESGRGRAAVLAACG
ncbi:MAG: sigma-70 family RNA polymerase sigma factor, partial [Armatimonadota bacterium]